LIIYGQGCSARVYPGMEDPRAQAGLAYTVPSLWLTPATYRDWVVVFSHIPLPCWRNGAASTAAMLSQK